MHVWDYDIGTLRHTEEGQRWRLERQLLFGLDGEKIPPALLRKHLPHLRLPPEYVRFLTLLLSG